jgi:hypothetical protein
MVFSSLMVRTTLADTFTAPYVQSSPTIDGTLGATEWSQATHYTVNLQQVSGSGANHDSTLYFEHDGRNLYIGVDSGLPTNFGNTWDFYWRFTFDGNHDGIMDGSLTEPHTDFSVLCHSPNGWPGSDQFKVNVSAVDSPDENQVTDISNPVGVSRATGGSSGDVTWEFQIPLSELGTTPGQSIGLAAYHGYEGSATTDFAYPGGQFYQPANWATVNLAPTPEPSTLAFLGVGAISLLGYAWRRRKAA